MEDIHMYTIQFIADQIGGKVLGNGEKTIDAVCTPEEIRQNCAVFVKDERNYKKIEGRTDTLCVIIPFKPEEHRGVDFILVDPLRKDNAFIRLLTLFGKEETSVHGVSEQSVISPDVVLGKDVTVCEFASIGANTIIEDGTYIGQGTVIGRDCRIGKGCTIYPNVVIYANSIIEENVVIHGGVVIGGDGFSYVKIDGVNTKIPQIGGVHIGKNVEIGANATVDRATIGYTRIGENTKIDNHVQIAHNCVIGKNTVICALTGVGGSVRIGDNVVVAGMVGLADHIVIEDDVFVGAKAGVMKKCVKKGTAVFGYPARDYKEEIKFNAMKPKLQALYGEVRSLKKKLDS